MTSQCRILRRSCAMTKKQGRTPNVNVGTEEIHRRDSLAMVSEERQPLLPRMWISGGSSDPSRNTPFRDIETQLEQFAVNAWRSPGRILGNHTKDQEANLFAHTLPSS
jgi:hypothetical protein